MVNEGPFVFLALATAVIAAANLFGVFRSQSARLKEHGHLVLSFVPWFHILISYAFASYVRIGFGRWPRSCIDNPGLPMVDGFLLVVVLGLLLVLWLLTPIWLGWLIIRLCQGFKRFWIWSAAAFVSGMVALIVLHVFDPWGFWDWVWD